ncbi:MAG: hypothetical protein JNL87_03115 [Burkholderiaceae bacterium]|nr:hypothetical protein [Burkholderiaceae bacterium]
MLKKPWVLALLAGLIVLLAAFALPLLRMAGGGAGADPASAAAGLPWQVRLLPDGHTEVFGVVPGRDTLADTEARFGDQLQVALVARLGETGVLEALVEPFVAGFVAGRLVLAFDADANALARWRDQSGTSQPMDGGLRRFTLNPAGRDEARRARLVGLSFVPGVRLSEPDVRQRFGAPAEMLAQPGGAQVLLYPVIGLSATVAEGQRGVLQYVAPAEFAARLRAPLVAAQVVPAGTR